MAGAAAAAQRMPHSETAALAGHSGAVLAVRWNADGNYCLSCGKDRTLRLWNPHKGTPVKVYAGHGREVRDVCVSSDNARLASCGGDRQIFYWDVMTGRILRKFRGHESDVNSVACHSGNGVVLSGGYDRRVCAWDTRSQSIDPIQELGVFRDSVMSVWATATEVIASSVDGTVRTFDVRMGRVLEDSLGPPVASVALTRDGKCMLAGCLDSCLRLLDRESGEMLNEYVGHTNEVYKVDSCASNTDEFVVSGSEDGDVVVWDLVEANVVIRWRAHTGVVTSVAYHPSKACLLTSSIDGTVRVWK